jgi:hypothetical protein
LALFLALTIRSRAAPGLRRIFKRGVLDGARVPTVLDLSQAVVVEFPVSGEWTAANTPAQRVPSHGTNFFAQRFAIDLFQVDWKTRSPCATLGWRRWLTPISAAAFHCWGQPVHAAFAGRVVNAGDGWPDRRRVHRVWEILKATTPLSVLTLLSLPRGKNYRPLIGNFVVVEGAPGVALYAHLQQGSLTIAVGDEVGAKTYLGNVGNSGNSTMPHLHFQVMDRPDPRKAKGKLCAFRGYERYVDGSWHPVAVGVPGYLERVRAV